MPTLDRGDIELYYEVVGSGPRLLVFNGSGGSIDGSRPLIDMLAARCEVLVHDQRCLGRSGIPTAQPTMAHYAADGAALLDHVGWETAMVFGISFGGMVAQELAVTWPERVERLALLCTSPGGDGGSSYPLHTLAAMEPADRARVSLHNLDTRFDAAWLEEHPTDRALVEMSAARAASKDPERQRGEVMQLEARRGHDVWDRLHRISCPTLVMCGEYDGLAPRANSEAIASRITHAELRSYQGGHMFIAQDRSASRDVLDFLAAPT
jgi:pimeloyl-ACP methyl ester carboxylesterase